MELDARSASLQDFLSRSRLRPQPTSGAIATIPGHLLENCDFKTRSSVNQICHKVVWIFGLRGRTFKKGSCATAPECSGIITIR